MAKEKAGFLVLLLLVGVVSGSGDGRGWSWRKAVLPRGGGEASTSSMAFNRGVGSSVVFNLHGNVYPIGFYNVTVYIGQPPKPYYLDVDTGSDLTWLQCDAPCVQCIDAPHPYYRPSNNLVPCKDPICASLHPPGHKCKDNEQCDYEVEYADGGSSLGVLVKDVFLLNFTNGRYHDPLLSLGCGYDQLPGGSYHPIDGVLGLGSGKSGILSQLSSHGEVRNVVGHCLSSKGGGFLFFGDDVYDSSRVSWTPMLQHDSKHYSPGYAELMFGGKSTGIKNLLIAIDSGSSYTYLGSKAYQVLIQLLNKELSGKPLREDWNDHTLPVCWKGQRPFRTVREARKYFKPLALSFSHGWRSKTQYEIPPESYLIISSRGNVCLGILNGTEVGLQDLTVLGDVSMQDRMVIYDNERQMIGWSDANCDRIPKFSAVF
ncbi:Aspartic proteinase Asp1 [Linum perenne]